MTHHARGTFHVALTRTPPYDTEGSVALGRVTIQKQFQGDLDATSVVEMLSAGSNVQGSAGYVAMEHVRGTLHGRRGSFVLQHSGTMNRGAASLSVTVVPDTGTGALEGLAGTMAIEIVDGNHKYVFDYTLGE